MSDIHDIDVSDDDVVNAVAQWGVDGIVLRDLCTVAIVLGLDPKRDIDTLEERMYALNNPGTRLTRPNGNDAYALTWSEWGLRLAGKSAQEITAALAGSRSRGCP